MHVDFHNSLNDTIELLIVTWQNFIEIYNNVSKCGLHKIDNIIILTFINISKVF